MIEALLNAYVPRDLGTAAAAVALLAALFLLGFFLPRLPARASLALGWLALPLSIVTADRLAIDAPPGFRMLAIVGAALYAMKGLAHRTGPPLPLLRWCFFCVAWFGMRPALFAKPFEPDRRKGVELMRWGAAQFALGVALVFSARAAASSLASPWIVWPLLLAGLSFMLHFGVFLILAGFWRFVGVGVTPLFRAPILSRTLKEFWGRRWNLAFSEMTSLTVYRPLSPFVGRSVAVSTAFLFSGLLHEIAISLPARAGYGWPFAYFAAHAFAMQLEARFGWGSRAWTIAWVLAPLPILFHAPFRDGVLAPWLG